jgi:hypothetical protein
MGDVAGVSAVTFFDARDRDDHRERFRRLSAYRTSCEEVRKQGNIAILRRQLLFKFQALDEVSETRLKVAPPEAIDRYLLRVLTADSLAAVFED